MKRLISPVLKLCPQQSNLGWFRLQCNHTLLDLARYVSQSVKEEYIYEAYFLDTQHWENCEACKKSPNIGIYLMDEQER